MSGAFYQTAMSCTAHQSESLLSQRIMLLLRNKTAGRVCLYIVAALGIYLGYVGFRINRPGFVPQVILALLLALAAVAAVVLERLGKGEKFLMLARGMAAFSLVAGLLNAFS